MPNPKQAAADPDAETLEGCRRGDTKALEQVFRSQLPALERLLARLLGPDPDRDDLLQQVLLEAVGAFPRFRGDATVRTWLAGIAVHVVRDHWRAPGRRRQVSLELVGEQASKQPGTGAVLADQREGIRRLYDALDRLSAKKRMAFVLHVFEGHSIAEVAVLMNATESATKSRVFFARRALVKRAAQDPVLRSLVARKQGAGDPR